MKKKHPSPSSAGGIPCFECEGGILQPALLDHHSSHPKLGEFVVPDVPVLRCGQCGDTVIGAEGNARIDGYLDKALNAISPEEVQAFLAKYHLTQKEASRITGLGEKNLSRWMTGRSRPSESVSNFLRLLLADSDAFELLRQKRFTGEVAASHPAEERQPTTEEKAVLKCVDYPKLVEIGLVPNERSPMERRTALCRWARCPDLVEFGNRMREQMDKMAAFKDTGQKSNPISGGLWVWLGEQAAAEVQTVPYSKDKLRKAVKDLRELSQHPLESIAPQVKAILGQAGVVLVFVPAMKETALRGCTRLLTPSRAMILHSLKYRNLSQFWIILFHEIAHLLLHIEDPGDSFTDYEEQSTDPRENDADNWAYDALVSLDDELEFKAKNPVPAPWQVEQFAKRIRVHPAIAAEVFNKRAGEEVISYSLLRMKGLFPTVDATAAKALMALTTERCPAH